MKIFSAKEKGRVGHRLYNVRFREVLQAAMDARRVEEAKRRANVGRGIALSGRHISRR